jgi:RHS repeat-associated protein
MSKRYLYGEAVDQIFAQEDLSKTLGDATRNLWPLVDHLGTVRDLAKQDGTIAAHYKYDSFGNVTSGDTSKTRYLFTSREFDTATKLQYNRARYYDAAVGRWISEDPLGFAAGDANVGRYIGNQVSDEMDPSGMDRRVRFFVHLWIEVDTYGPGGKKVGVAQLHVNLWKGYHIIYGPFPGAPVRTIESGQEADELLVKLWTDLGDLNNGRLDWLDYYVWPINCYSATLMFDDAFVPPPPATHVPPIDPYEPQRWAFSPKF